MKRVAGPGIVGAERVGADELFNYLDWKFSESISLSYLDAKAYDLAMRREEELDTSPRALLKLGGTENMSILAVDVLAVNRPLPALRI